MKIYPIVVLIIFVLGILEVSFLPVFGIYADPVLSFLLSLVYTTNKEFSLKTGFFSGIFIDVVSSKRFSTFTLFYVLVIIAAFGITNLLGRRLVYLLLSSVIFYALEQVMMGSPFVLSGALCTGVLTLAFIGLVSFGLSKSRSGNLRVNI